MKKNNVTFNDIAKYTNFSKTTISRYFNHPDSLTPENQKIITKALEELNYQENKVAKILANGRTEFVGVIIPNLFMHYYSEILSAILDTYEEFGYKFLVFAGNEKEDVERKYIQELLSYKIEGMIILSHTIPSKELASYHIPLVTIEREDQYVCSVNTDNYMGALQASRHLINKGCDVLIHINSDIASDKPAYGRIQGFKDVCEEYHIPHEIMLSDMGLCHEENCAALSRLLDVIEEKYRGQTKGIFLSNDIFANILLNKLIQRYGKLPDDYKIIGFDNSPVSWEAIVPTSTVGQPIDKIAHAALQLLTEQISEKHVKGSQVFSEPVHKMITPVLISRDTTL